MVVLNNFCLGSMDSTSDSWPPTIIMLSSLVPRPSHVLQHMRALGIYEPPILWGYCSLLSTFFCKMITRTCSHKITPIRMLRNLDTMYECHCKPATHLCFNNCLRNKVLSYYTACLNIKTMVTNTMVLGGVMWFSP